MRDRRGIGLAPMARKPQTCVAAVERDLAGVPAEVASSGLALCAIALARRLDDGETSAAAAASCGRALTRALAELRGLCPPKVKASAFDEVAHRRRERRKASGG
jgi:hypothetical protein